MKKKNDFIADYVRVVSKIESTEEMSNEVGHFADETLLDEEANFHLHFEQMLFEFVPRVETLS
jgi:hypothetical protein